MDSKLEIARKLFNEGRYNEALALEHKNVEEYIELYKRDTVPMKNYSPHLYDNLLQIDIKALSESISFLIQCYEKTNKKFDILNFFNKLEHEIDTEIWRQKLFYHKIGIKAFVFKDELGAIDELKKIDNITEIQDVDLLTIYLDLMSDDLTFSKKIQINEIIIRNTECSTLELKYQTSLGLQYLMVGDDEKAIIEIENGLNQFDAEKNQQDDVFTDYIFGGSYYLLGIITQDTKLLVKARDYYLKSLSSEIYNADGKAELFKSIGYCYHASDDFILAKDYYLQSLKLKKLNETIIELIRVLMQMEADQTEIDKWISKIDEESLNGSEKYDYLIVCAEIAIEKDDYNSSKGIYEELEKLELKEPYFKEIRNETVKELMKFCISKNHSTKGKIILKLNELWQNKRKHIMFQPNLYGIGFK